MTYVFLFGAVLALLAAVVAVSVLRGGAETAEEPPLDELPPAARREAALEALRRAEFDYRTGKLPEEEYRDLRRRYGRAVLDAEAAETRASASEERASASEERDRVPRGAAAAGAERTCRSCGAPADPGARFCARCGERLAGRSVQTRTEERA